MSIEGKTNVVDFDKRKAEIIEKKNQKDLGELKRTFEAFEDMTLDIKRKSFKLIKPEEEIEVVKT